MRDNGNKEKTIQPNKSKVATQIPGSPSRESVGKQTGEDIELFNVGSLTLQEDQRAPNYPGKEGDSGIIKKA